MPRRRGQPQLYDEPKSEHIYADMTRTGKQGLDRKIFAYSPRLSRQEFLERLGRGEIDDPVHFCKVFFDLDIFI